MKKSIFIFVSRLLGTKEGQEHPKWLLILFFPIRYYAVEYSGLKYDFMRDVYIIDEVEYSRRFFGLLSKMEDGEKYTITKNDGRIIFFK